MKSMSRLTDDREHELGPGPRDDDVAGTLVYRAPGGASYVSVSFLAEQVSVSGANRCIFGGTATVVP